MIKKTLNLSVNGELIVKARKYGINLSAFLEIKLEEYLALIHGKSNIIRISTDPWGFEPQLSAPKADRISRLPYGPKIFPKLKNLL